MDRTIRIQRVYDRGKDEGARFLVDGLWPRGIARADLEGIPWLKHVAPSAGLRSWYAHDPARFAEFRDRYRRELHDHDLSPLLDAIRDGPVTLLHAARDSEHSNAAVLREYLEELVAG